MKKVIVNLLLLVFVAFSSLSGYAVSANNVESEQNVSEAEILAICKWYISTPLSDSDEQLSKRAEAAQLFVTYAITTDKFELGISPAVEKLIDLTGNHHESPELLTVYIAGEIIYCLEHDLKVSNADSFASAMEDVMNFYSQLPVQSVNSLNKYLNMDTAKRLESFKKIYNKNK